MCARALINDLTTQEAAYVYADSGLPVLLLVPGEKRPLTRHGCKDATCCTETIDALYRRYNPEANIGIATGTVEGSGQSMRIVCIDDDSAKHDGMESYIDVFERETGMVFPRDTVTVRTGNGGIQYLFEDADRSIVKGGARASVACDIRADGGFICTTPSRLDNGGAYQFVDGKAPGQVPFHPVDDVVEAFYRLWQQTPTGKASKSSAGRQRARSTVYDAGSYFWPGEVGNGGRNDALIAFLGCCIGWQLTDDVIEEVASAFNDDVLTPPLDAGELEFTVGHALGAYGDDRDYSWADAKPEDAVTMVTYRAFKKDFPAWFTYIILCSVNEHMLDGAYEAEQLVSHINRYIRRYGIDAEPLDA